jgi:hypothetical protein
MEELWQNGKQVVRPVSKKEEQQIWGLLFCPEVMEAQMETVCRDMLTMSVCFLNPL